MKPHPTPVVFSHLKYGQPLAVDASPFPQWTGIVADGEPHVLDFHEFLLVSGGRADLIVGDRAVRVRGPAIVITPPQVARRIEVVDPLDLHLVVFSDRALARTAWLPALKGAAAPIVRAGEVPQLQSLQAVARLMAVELAALRPDSAMMLDALLAQFLITLNRARGTAMAPPKLLTRFERLLERRFRHDHAVSAYASLLGVSTDHLSAVVRLHFGVSAKTLIDRRIFAEAVRLVSGSQLSIADVGAAIGFDEPAHFARFFARMSGQSPRSFRAAH
jgi:AraC-like DNA-binding protein